jgi:hypothetical protein
MIGMTELALDTVSTEEQRDLLRPSRGSAETLLSDSSNWRWSCVIASGMGAVLFRFIELPRLIPSWESRRTKTALDRSLPRVSHLSSGRDP